METEDLAGWQPVSWIRSQHLDYNGAGIGLNYHLRIISAEICRSHAERNRKIHGSRPELAGQNVRMSVFRCLFGRYDTAVCHVRNSDVTGISVTVPTNCNFLIWILWMRALYRMGFHFDKKEIAKNLTLFLYPDDSDEDGRKLRIYQQYFMVSNGAQLILKECEDAGM